MPTDLTTRPVMTDPIKDRVRAHYDALAPSRDTWYRRNHYYHAYVERSLRALMSNDAR